jgi:hypothetical protein
MIAAGAVAVLLVAAGALALLGRDGGASGGEDPEYRNVRTQIAIGTGR